MSFPPPPARPEGDSSAAIYMQRVWDINWDPKTSIFVDTPLLKFDKTPKGYVPVLRIPAQKSNPAIVSNASWFQIETRLTGDYFMAKEVTSIGQTQSGPNLFPTALTLATTAVQVAKQINMRRSVGKETYDGGILTYSSQTADIDNNRQSQDAQNNTQLEYAYPRYLTIAEVKAAGIYANNIIPLDAQCYILAASMPDGAGVFVVGSKVVWQEISPPRVWDTP